MLDTLSYRFGLWKLQREKATNRRFYKKRIDEARKANKPRDRIEAIANEELEIIERIDDRIATMQHRLVVRQAEKYLIPTPEYSRNNGKWEQSEITGRWRHSGTTIRGLMNSIRLERKDRRERWHSWLAAITGLIGALTGIVGALIGLLSVLSSD